MNTIDRCRVLTMESLVDDVNKKLEEQRFMVSCQHDTYYLFAKARGTIKPVEIVTGDLTKVYNFVIVLAEAHDVKLGQQ